MGAQHDIDSIILDTFGKNKVFIEAGGSDPEDQSNTFLLEQNGWKGLVVEPATRYNDDYKTRRPNTIVENYALVSKNYAGTTITGGFSQPMTGSVYNGNVTVPCCTLDHLIKKHSLHEIHFLSLDVEGYENEVIEGIDFSNTFIHCIVLENHTQYNPDLFNYIEKYGFKKVHTLYSHDYFLNTQSPFKFINNYLEQHKAKYLQNKFFFTNQFFD